MKNIINITQEEKNLQKYLKEIIPQMKKISNEEDCKDYCTRYNFNCNKFINELEMLDNMIENDITISKTNCQLQNGIMIDNEGIYDTQPNLVKYFSEKLSSITIKKARESYRKVVNSSHFPMQPL